MIRGYISDVSNVNLAKERKQSKMFIIVFSFSPEKRQLLLKISKESSQHIGAEIKPSNESNDLRVTME